MTKDQESSLKGEGAAFWNQNPCGGEWPNYRAFQEWIQRTEPYIFDVLRSHRWEGLRVVEVGCGQGTTLNFLPSLGAAMSGVDMSESSLAVARAGAKELGYEVQLQRADAEHLPFDDATFDAGISIGVLHHTPDTAAGVRELLRVVKPGGLVIVMLYRRGNPKWWATRTMRALSWLVDKAAGRPFVIADALRRKRERGQPVGTALLELFGVPILDAYTNKESLAFFATCSSARVTNHAPGFERMCDISSIFKPFRLLLRWLDRVTKNAWGFYQVVEARK